MTATRRIVFHSSTDPTPPHTEGKSTNQRFHVGTIGAAIERTQFAHFNEWSEWDDDAPDVVSAWIHSYEIDVPNDLHVYDDPHGSGYDEFTHPDWEPSKALCENSVSEIAAYRNLHEDAMSVSYVIHKIMFCKGSAVFVGSLPFTVRAEIGERQRIETDLGYL